MQILALRSDSVRQSTSPCRQPRGWLGRLSVWSMNRRHSALTDWGLQQVSVGAGDTMSIEQGSVAALPYAAGTFDLATAIETHFWWQSLGDGMREIVRVLKPGGTLSSSPSSTTAGDTRATRDDWAIARNRRVGRGIWTTTTTVCAGRSRA